MATILFDADMYCRFVSISKLINWVTSDTLLHKGLKNQKFSLLIRVLVDLIMCLVFIKNRTHGFLTFTYPCISSVFEFLGSHKDSVIPINQTC